MVSVRLPEHVSTSFAAVHLQSHEVCSHKLASCRFFNHFYIPTAIALWTNGCLQPVSRDVVKSARPVWLGTLETGHGCLCLACFRRHEQVAFFFDRQSGLKAIVALHDTALGPAIGGCRMWPYAERGRGADRRAAAREGHDLQGGDGRPAVRRRQDRDHRRSPDRQVAGAVPRARPGDRQLSAAATSPPRTSASVRPTWTGRAPRRRYVLGRSSGSSGDPSPVTARGVWLGIRAAVEHQLGRADLDGIRVAVQGVGHVGYNLAQAARAGRRQADRRRRRSASAPSARPRSSALAWSMRRRDPRRSRPRSSRPARSAARSTTRRCPGWPARSSPAPPTTSCSRPAMARALHARGILYAPDYVINAGGLINIAEELRPSGYQRGRALAKVQAIAADADRGVRARRARGCADRARSPIGWPTSGSGEHVAASRSERRAILPSCAADPSPGLEPAAGARRSAAVGRSGERWRHRVAPRSSAGCWLRPASARRLERGHAAMASSGSAVPDRALRLAEVIPPWPLASSKIGRRSARTRCAPRSAGRSAPTRPLPSRLC